MNIQEILINLKVLEKVQIQDKLISRGQYLNIEYASIVPLPVRRWIRQDNRQEMIKKLQYVIQGALEQLRVMNTSAPNFLIQETKQPVAPADGLDIKQYLSKSISGLQNLKETYASCTTTCAQLDVMIDSIQTAIA